MRIEQDKIINGLQDLIADRESFITNESDKENIFVKDKEVLEEATKLIQEQQAEIEKKDKIIYKMEEHIHMLCIQDIKFIRKWWENNICKNKACDENVMCEDCIKQYFERKVEE